MTGNSATRDDGGPSQLMRRVSAAVEARGLGVSAAAALIGVGVATLRGHLRGEHVRSDSARKYEDWLAGRDSSQRRIFHHGAVEERRREVPASEPAVLPARPDRPHLVVDIFAGCGGLSLGFDLLAGGGFFRTVLALDIQQAPIDILNANHPSPVGAHTPVGRVVDLTEFLHEAEVVAFYLDHAIRLHGDRAARTRFDSLADGAFPRLLAGLTAIDAAFLEELAAARSGSAYREGLARLDKGSLLQTSVTGFHEKLKLPRTTARGSDLPAVIWSDLTSGATPDPGLAAEVARTQLAADLARDAREVWDGELLALERKRESKGQGQLESSARRIGTFLAFAWSDAFAGVRDAWCRWRAARLALRIGTFGNPLFAPGLRKLYEASYPVSVLLGGPPCQGFSRIGRGKIRSLREASVHVHGDEEAGDARNRLYERYLLVVSALRPLVFKFENVQHFQSTVKAGGRTFLASEVLAEAIREMSADGSGEGLSYAVASRTIDASRHGVPQTRQRFFMSGVRRDALPPETDPERAAAECLTLPETEEVPLRTALEDLPEPSLAGGGVVASDAMTLGTPLPGRAVDQRPDARNAFRSWLCQPRPDGSATTETDAHVARACRLDDARLFALMGPGMRWMDYRVDEAPTVGALSAVLRALASLPKGALDALSAKMPPGASLPPSSEIKALSEAADGSLAIRLLLEMVGERLGAPHHLLKRSYLDKRDGHHGDWVARLDGTRPCKTIVAHIAKDSYAYVHPQSPRMISVREAARVQTFPDWFSFGTVSLTDAFRMIGNAVPPLLSHHIAARVATVLERSRRADGSLQVAAE